MSDSKEVAEAELFSVEEHADTICAAIAAFVPEPLSKNLRDLFNTHFSEPIVTLYQHRVAGRQT